MLSTKQIAYAVLLVVSGSVATLMTKWAVKSTACGAYDCSLTRQPRPFVHPYVLSLIKFIGELSCFVIYLLWRAIRKRRSAGTDRRVETMLPCCHWFAFLPPAICSVVANVTVHIGLNLTYTSTGQMLRGTSVLFVGLLSVAFLAQTVLPHHWLGMVVTAVGLALVGSADIIFNETHDAAPFNLNAVIAGGLLILLAQVIAATQSVLEQRYIRKYNVPPLLAVGLEGLFGTVIVGTLIIPMYYIKANLPLTTDPNGKLENIQDALKMMVENWHIMFGILGMLISGTIFNYAGMVIIKDQNAVTKSVLDSCQVVPTWITSSLVGWMKVSTGALLMEIGGSILILFFGPTIFFDSIFAPYLRRLGWIKVRAAWEHSGDDFNRRPTHPGDLHEWGAQERELEAAPEGDQAHLRAHDDDEPLLSA